MTTSALCSWVYHITFQHIPNLSHHHHLTTTSTLQQPSMSWVVLGLIFTTRINSQFSQHLSAAYLWKWESGWGFTLPGTLVPVVGLCQLFIWLVLPARMTCSNELRQTRTRCNHFSSFEQCFENKHIDTTCK